MSTKTLTGFRSPAAPGLTSSLRINRQGPRRVTGSNTGDEGQAHDQKRGPLSGEARLYRAHVKNTSHRMTMALGPAFHVNQNTALLNDIARIRQQRTMWSRPGSKNVNDASIRCPEHWQTPFDPSC